MKSKPNKQALLLDARIHAEFLYRGEFRKGETDLRLKIEHLDEVSNLVRYTGGDEEQQIAGLFHDSIEENKLTPKEIEEKYGKKVRVYVCEVTDPPNFKELPTTERKAVQASRMQSASPGGKRIKLSDVISNLREIVSNPPAGWDLEKKRDYIRGSMRVAMACQGVSKELDRIFGEVHRAAFQKYFVDSART